MLNQQRKDGSTRVHSALPLRSAADADRRIRRKDFKTAKAEPFKT
jgi:hypothetical protein